MTKRCLSVRYHRNPRLTFDWHLHCYIRNLGYRVYNTKNNFKFTTKRTRKGSKPMFNRNLRCGIPYPAKYHFEKLYIKVKQ